MRTVRNRPVRISRSTRSDRVTGVPGVVAVLGPVEPDDVGPDHCSAPASARADLLHHRGRRRGVGSHPLSRPAEPPRRREDGGRRIGSQGGPAVRGRQRPAEGLGQEPDGRALRDRGALIGQVQFEQLPGDLEPAPAERREDVGSGCRPCRPRRTGAGGPRRAGPRGPRRARQVRQVRQVHPQTAPTRRGDRLPGARRSPGRRPPDGRPPRGDRPPRTPGRGSPRPCSPARPPRAARRRAGRPGPPGRAGRPRRGSP